MIRQILRFYKSTGDNAADYGRRPAVAKDRAIIDGGSSAVPASLQADTNDDNHSLRTSQQEDVVAPPYTSILPSLLANRDQIRMCVVRLAKTLAETYLLTHHLQSPIPLNDVPLEDAMVSISRMKTPYHVCPPLLSGPNWSPLISSILFVLGHHLCPYCKLCWYLLIRIDTIYYVSPCRCVNDIEVSRRYGNIVQSVKLLLIV